MTVRRTLAFVSLCAVIGGAACATVDPPQELLNARAAYIRVSSGTARQVTPVEVDNARLALTDAENAFRDHGDSPMTRDLSYVAERRALQASAVADTVVAQQRNAQIQVDQTRRQATQLAQTSAALGVAQQNLAQDQQALSQEHQARTEAERTAAAALESLRQVASVREEARGTVITLSGEVLFASGQSVLLPIAQQRLGQVAAMLRDNPNRDIEVDGFTDSRGSVSTNSALSLARAQSVREYLVSQGVPSERIRAQGFGPAQPVADNNTPEGRADNRRVEIVVAPGGEPRAIGGGPMVR